MSRTNRVLPHPLLSALLLGLWLLLANSVTAGQALLGLMLAVLLPWLTRRYWPAQVTLHRPWTVVRLAARVLWDIVVANVKVARLILGRTSTLQPAFMAVPLSLENPLSITLLASIISLTPGTVTADISPDRSRLWIHGLDVPDPDATVAYIKAHYEAPLMEIFQC
ncbi:MAG: Na+/H+ antiporter subunit E [Gammaproteobacteria bacterium]